MTIYSVRNSLGQEVWWTTSRRKAIIRRDQLNDGADIPPRTAYTPFAVYKSTVVRTKEQS